MSRGWFNHPYKHKLASQGIETSAKGVDPKEYDDPLIYGIAKTEERRNVMNRGIRESEDFAKNGEWDKAKQRTVAVENILEDMIVFEHYRDKLSNLISEMQSEIDKQNINGVLKYSNKLREEI